MSDLKIQIPHSGLKLGEHQFDFLIGNRFFEQFEASEIKKGKIKVRVILQKGTRLFELKITIKGYVEVECDLCLELFDLPFDYHGNMYVKFGKNQDEKNDELIIIDENESNIDLTQYIYESICLSLPYKKVHSPNLDDNNSCNRAMIKKLNSHVINKKEEYIDPRWDKLKDIMN